MIITEQMGMSWATEREDFTFKIINKIIIRFCYMEITGRLENRVRASYAGKNE